MSEVEKLYSLAGVDFGYNNFGVPNIQPPFTAEKQIELIKWLALRFNSDYVSYWHNEIKDVWIFRVNDLTEFSSEEPCIYEGRNKDFTEVLCNLINALWQDLTSAEQNEIKNILKGEDNGRIKSKFNYRKYNR